MAPEDSPKDALGSGNESFTIKILTDNKAEYDTYQGIIDSRFTPWLREAIPKKVLEEIEGNFAKEAVSTTKNVCEMIYAFKYSIGISVGEGSSRFLYFNLPESVSQI